MEEDLIKTAEELLDIADNGTDECMYYNDGFIDGVRFAIKALRQDDVSSCAHPFKQVVSGDEGMFCIECQKYIYLLAHCH